MIKGRRKKYDKLQYLLKAQGQYQWIDLSYLGNYLTQIAEYEHNLQKVEPLLYIDDQYYGQFGIDQPLSISEAKMEDGVCYYKVNWENKRNGAQPKPGWFAQEMIPDKNLILDYCEERHRSEFK